MEVKATNNDYYLPDATRQPKQELDKDAFLMIMMEQLKNQDPTSPMDTDQFVSEMAQFTTLEQMTNMNAQITDLLHSQQIDQGAAMIGNTVTLLDGQDVITGVVEKVAVVDDAVRVMVNGSAYDINAVVIVEGKTPQEQQPEEDDAETIDEDSAVGEGENADGE